MTSLLILEDSDAPSDLDISGSRDSDSEEENWSPFDLGLDLTLNNLTQDTIRFY